MILDQLILECVSSARLNSNFYETVFNLSKFQIKLECLFDLKVEMKVTEEKTIINTSGQ